jgi:hypothetical protein
MRVRLAHGRTVLMPVVLVMNVGVLVLERLVNVLLGVARAENGGEPCDHEGAAATSRKGRRSPRSGI